MLNPLTWTKAWFRTFKRAHGGELLKQIDVEHADGWATFSFQFKREKRSGAHYAMLTCRMGAAESYHVQHHAFDLHELNAFIGAGDELLTSLTGTITSAPNTRKRTSSYRKLVTSGEELKQINTYVSGGGTCLSLRLKREAESGYEYVVLSATGLGLYSYHPLDLQEFHHLMSAAKRIRAFAELVRELDAPAA